MTGKLIVASLLSCAAAAYASRDVPLGEVLRAPGTRARTPAALERLAWADTEEPQSREELEAEKQRVERHLLRVQQERFEARARGESEKGLERLDREFKRTQQRRVDVLRDLKAAEE